MVTPEELLNLIREGNDSSALQNSVISGITSAPGDLRSQVKRFPCRIVRGLIMLGLVPTRRFFPYGAITMGPPAGKPRVPIFESFSSRCSSRGSPRGPPVVFLMNHHNGGPSARTPPVPIFESYSSWCSSRGSPAVVFVHGLINFGADPPQFSFKD